MTYIGLDPGQTGGIAILDDDGTVAFICEMPPLNELTKLFKHENPKHVFVEQVSVRPGQGISSGFKFGCHFGSILGALTALGIPHTLLRPQTWQKLVVTGTSGTDPKKRAEQAALRIWPNVDWKKSARCKKNHDGMIDAALICLAGIKHLKGAR